MSTTSTLRQIWIIVLRDLKHWQRAPWTPLFGIAFTIMLVLVFGYLFGGSIELPGRTEGVRVTASRTGIERTLATAARRPDGVRSARVRAGRRAVRVRATTGLRSTEELRQPVTTAVTDRLEELGLTGVLRPRVTVSQESSR